MTKVKSKTLTKSDAKVGDTDTRKRKEKPSAMSRVKTNLKTRVVKVSSIFNNTFSRLKPAKKPSKLSKKAQDERRKASLKQLIRGIIGIWLLLVVVSIAFSSYITTLFLDGPMVVIALVPQISFAVIILLIAFYKLLK